MGALGLAGLVSARGWVELHNPPSTKLSLRQFNINDCRSKVSASKDSDQSQPGFIELEEFKLALRTMRTAMCHVMNWNFSIMAIEGFFLQTLPTWTNLQSF